MKKKKKQESEALPQWRRRVHEIHPGLYQQPGQNLSELPNKQNDSVLFAKLLAFKINITKQRERE